MSAWLVLVLCAVAGALLGVATHGGVKAVAVGAVTGMAAWLVVWALYEVFVAGVSDNCDPSLSQVSKHCTR